MIFDDVKTHLDYFFPLKATEFCAYKTFKSPAKRHEKQWKLL